MLAYAWSCMNTSDVNVLWLVVPPETSRPDEPSPASSRLSPGLKAAAHHARRTQGKSCPRDGELLVSTRTEIGRNGESVGTYGGSFQVRASAGLCGPALQVRAETRARGVRSLCCHAGCSPVFSVQA
jgi:hypothetical protein